MITVLMEMQKKCFDRIVGLKWNQLNILKISVKVSINKVPDICKKIVHWCLNKKYKLVLFKVFKKYIENVMVQATELLLWTHKETVSLLAQ